MVLILSLSKDEGHPISARVQSSMKGKGKGRGGKGRDTGGGRASLPLSRGAYGGEGAASALRRGGMAEAGPARLGAEGGVAAKLARTIEGIVPLLVKVLCLWI